MCTQLFFQVIMYCTNMIEVLLGVGLSAHKWSAPQRWSAPQLMTVSHMRTCLRFKVHLIGCALRSKVRVSRSAHNVVQIIPGLPPAPQP